MLMVGGQSIRDVIAFPKTQSAQCVMTEAPGEVSEQQLGSYRSGHDELTVPDGLIRDGGPQ